MPTGSNGPLWKRAVGLLVAAVAYVLAFGAGLGLESAETGIPIFFPASGLAVMLAYRWGRDMVLLITLLSGLIGTYVYSSGVMGLSFAVGFGGAAFFAGDLLRRWRVEAALERITDVLRFGLVAVVLAPLWSALCTLGGLWLAGLGTEEVGGLVALLHFWLSAALGTLVACPVFLVWSANTRINWKDHQLGEVLLWLVVMLGLEMLVFLNWAPVDTLRYPLEIAVFPVVLWSAVRFGQRGATVGVVLTALMAALMTEGGAESGTQPAIYLWVFVGVVACTTLLLAAVFTEYRNREDEIRMNEERLRAFVRAIPDLAFVISAEGWYLDVFAPRASVFSERAQLLKGRRLQDIYPKSLQDQFMQVISEVLSTGEVRVWRYVMEFRGLPRWFEGRVAPMEPIEGHPRSVFWVAYDITESQRANAALHERDRLLQAVTEAEATLLRTQDYETGIRRTLEIIGKGIALDRIEVFLLRAEAGEDVLRSSFLWNHRPQAGPVGAYEQDRSAPVLREAEFRGPWGTLRGGSTWTLRGRSDAPAKVTAGIPPGFTVSSLWVPIFVEESFAGAIAFSVFREIREWNENAHAVLLSLAGSLGGFIATKRIEDALKDAKRQADAANSAKSDFLAMMSHEIRTPMNAILGFADLLEQSGLPEQQAEYAHIIGRSGRDLLELINHILDFSKLESGPIQLERTRLNLETTVMEVLEIMLMKAREKNLVLDYELDDETDKVYMGDPLRVRQILLNLVSNAVKFTRTGEVVVTVESRLERGAHHLVHFAVRDTGIGIHPEKMDDLFKAFTQLDSSTTREYGGTGLGLTITQRLAEKMDGRIWAESEVGKGSTFHVEIRLEKEDHEAEKAGGPEAVVRISPDFARVHPLRILLAEDDPRNTRLAQEVLGQLGFDPVCVEDGRAALERLAGQPFDVVLLDIHMAHADGITIAKALRAGEVGSLNEQCILIALTASVFFEDERRCRQAGIDAFLAKPFALRDLVAELRNAAESLAARRGEIV
ncbi:MAG: ATP-binding protein [Verrucomicrobiota bacterium]